MQKQNRHSQSALGLGLQTLIARAKNTVKSYALLGAFVWLPIWCVLSYGFIRANTTADERYMTGKWAEAWFFADLLRLRGYKIIYIADRSYRLNAGTLYDWPELSRLASSTWAKTRPGIVTDAFGAAFMTWLLALGIERLGRRLRGDQILRGGRLVTPSELIKEVRRRKQASSLLIGNVPLVAGSETQHLSLTGTTGTGKTVLLHSLVDQLGPQIPLLIYDTKGDFLSIHFDNERDMILNLLDARAPLWTPWNEIEGPADAWMVAEAWIPQRSQGQEPIWTESSRQMLADMLLCTPRERRTNAELFRLCNLSSTDELKALLVGTPSARYFADAAAERMRESVRNTLSTSLRSLQFLDPQARAGEGFSMRQWMREAACAGYGGRIFIGCPPDQAPAISPIVAVMMESAAASLMSLGPDRKRRVGFVIDEFPTLPPMNYLLRLMAEGRAYGAIVVLASQAHAQVRRTYGLEAAETIASLCSTHIVFRVTDSDSADRASKMLGEAEFDESRESDSHGVAGASTSLGSQRIARRTVLASEILSLPNLHAYVKLSGDLPVGLVRLKPRKRTPVAPAYVPRPTDSALYRPATPKPNAEPEAGTDKGLL